MSVESFHSTVVSHKEKELGTPQRTKRFKAMTPGEQNEALTLGLNEIAKKTLMSYINKAQDRPDRMWKRPDSSTKSYDTAQKKIGQSQSKPKVMGTGSLREAWDYKDGATVSHLKAMAKNSPHGVARYVAHPTGRLTIGDATKFDHAQLGGGNPKNMEGFVRHHDEDHYTYDAFPGGDFKPFEGHHRMMDHFKTHHVDRERSNLPESLNEARDPYPVKNVHNQQVTPEYSTHTYKFNSPNDKYTMNIDHNHTHNEMDVTMRSLKGGVKLSNAEGMHAHKVFDTMRHVMDTHAKEHGVARTTFYGFKDDGHDKLYNHMFKNRPGFEARDEGQGVHYSYMNEGWEERKPINNVGVMSLKNIAKGSLHGTARFSIQNNRINAGDAHYFQHDDLANDAGSSVNGYISHNAETGEHHYAAYTNKGKGFERADHPLLDKMETHGVKRGLYHDGPDDYVGKVKPFAAGDDTTRYKANLPHHYDYKESVQMGKNLRDIVPEAEDPKAFHTSPFKKRRTARAIGSEPAVNEAEDIHMIPNHTRHNQSFEVYKNPDTKDARRIHDEALSIEKVRNPKGYMNYGGGIRTLKHGPHLYAWAADHAAHHRVANNLGISPNDRSEGRYFTSHELKANKFDIHKSHELGGTMNEISRDSMNKYRDSAERDIQNQDTEIDKANNKIATIPSGNLSTRMNAYQARSTAMRRMSRRDRGIANADKLASNDAYKAQQNANEGEQADMAAYIWSIGKKKVKVKVDPKLNEVSTALLQRYITKGAKNMANKAYALGQASMEKKPNPDAIKTLKVKNRASGIAKAAANLASRDFTYKP